MPPVLHISLNELMSGVQDYLRANCFWPAWQKGERVLELISESKSAATLIER
jgi:hypothetical protein